MNNPNALDKLLQQPPRNQCTCCLYFDGEQEEEFYAQLFYDKLIRVDYTYDNFSNFDELFQSIEGLQIQIQKIYQELKNKFLSRKNNVQAKIFNLKNLTIPKDNFIVTVMEYIKPKSDEKYFNQLEEILRFFENEMKILNQHIIGYTKGILKQEQESNWMWQIGQYKYEGIRFKDYKPEKFIFNVEFTKELEIIYKDLNGNIKRMQQYSNYEREKVKDLSKKPEIIPNYEQIKSSYWKGQYDKRNLKIGKWNIIWKQKLLPNIGGYYYQGMKHGLWNELIKNFCSFVNCFEQGIYEKQQKIGKWKIFNGKDKKIGGGQYSFHGKIGKWVELFEGFYENAQVTYNGEYNMNNMKVGRWDIMYCQWNEKEYKQINISNLQLQWWWII